MADNQEKAAGPAPAKDARGKFVTGPTMNHVVVMTMTAAVGLMAVFVVDFINLFYISLLGATELAAAIGYAGTVFFFNFSLCIGLMVATAALAAQALGPGNKEEARQTGASSLILMVVATSVLAICLIPFLGSVLELLGATGEAHEVAHRYLLIVIPSLPILGLGLAFSGLLRAVGDARRAMYVTLAGGVTTAVLDPILIFVLDLGVDGAAIASVGARIAIVLMGYHGAVRVHDLVARPSFSRFKQDLRPLLGIAVPAVLTNMATPVGNGYVTAAMAPYGDDAVAGWAIIGRLIPVAFGVVFALTGAVGPILGQNFGAGQIDRVRQGFIDALKFTFVFVLAVWAILWIAQDLIAMMFSAKGETAYLIGFFCTWVAGSFLFNGALFVTNASFNNLGFPAYSTAFNWARSTLGIIPFVWLGSQWYGAPGVLAGHGLGAVMFGTLAVLVCLKKISTLEAPESPAVPRATTPSAAHSPFTTGKGGTVG